MRDTASPPFLPVGPSMAIAYEARVADEALESVIETSAAS